jgi:hypothetical protein
MVNLIDELYTAKEGSSIKSLFLEDPDLKKSILDAIGSKVFLDKHKILLSKPIDIIYIVCLMSKFASSEDECFRVAVSIFQHFTNTKNILPMMSEDKGLLFATKTLISLSFHLPALKKRWEFHGAPSPDYYRQISKTVFCIYGQEDLAEHHEQWENFLSEFFI